MLGRSRFRGAHLIRVTGRASATAAPAGRGAPARPGARVAARALVGLGVLCALLAPPPAPAAGSEWSWPVRGRLLARFHLSGDRFAAGQHRGIDIGASRGTPVASACPGRVAFAGWVPAAGRTVSVRCGPLTASYLHLASIAVRRGAWVARGGRLGRVGASGRPRLRSPHLHFGVRWTGRRWAYVDPLSLLGDGGPDGPGPVLAPTRLPPAGPLGPAPVPLPARPGPVSALPRVPAPYPGRSPAGVPARAPGRLPAGSPAQLPAAAWVGLALVAVAVPIDVVRGRSRGRRRRLRPANSAVRQRAAAG